MPRISIKPDTYQYPDLIAKIEQGLVKIPAFQRNFVWPMDRTVFLLDSICRRFPIGTFLFWQSSDFVNALKNIGNLDLASPPEGYPIQYVLDGQQRLTSLYAALKGAQINGQSYKIAVDLDAAPDDEEIIVQHDADNARYVLLSDLLGDEYGDLFAALSSERRKRFNDIRTTFLNYPFSVTLVEGGDLDIVCDLFERINNTGMELSVFDLLVARTWSPPENGGGFDLRVAFEELMAELGEVGFEEIPEPVIAQLAGALIQEDCTRKAILKIGRDEMREAWPALTDSIRGAIDFVRKKMRVTASRLLPYPSLLVPLSYFYYKNELRNPDGSQSAWLTRYFYLNGFANRLSSGTQSKLTEDIRIIADLAAGGPAKFDVPVAVAPEDIRGTELRIGNAYCKSVLCLLATQGPLDLRDSSAIILQNRALKQANSRHYHHIFPKAFVRGKPGAEEVNSIANVSLIPADLNIRIGAKAPSEYLERFNGDNPHWDETLSSHLIAGSAREAMEEDEFLRFIEGRAGLLSGLAGDVLGISREVAIDRSASANEEV